MKPKRKRPYGYRSRHFVCYWWFVSWHALSLGVSLHLGAPNIEIHLPFGFLRIGRELPPVDLVVWGADWGE